MPSPARRSSAGCFDVVPPPPWTATVTPTITATTAIASATGAQTLLLVMVIRRDRRACGSDRASCVPPDGDNVALRCGGGGHHPADLGLGLDPKAQTAPGEPNVGLPRDLTWRPRPRAHLRFDADLAQHVDREVRRRAGGAFDPVEVPPQRCACRQRMARGHLHDDALLRGAGQRRDEGREVGDVVEDVVTG